jgi:hypothetical protein
MSEKPTSHSDNSVASQEILFTERSAGVHTVFQSVVQFRSHVQELSVFEIRMNWTLVKSRTEKQFERRNFNICHIHHILLLFKHPNVESIGKTCNTNEKKYEYREKLVSESKSIKPLGVLWLGVRKHSPLSQSGVTGCRLDDRLWQGVFFWSHFSDWFWDPHKPTDKARSSARRKSAAALSWLLLFIQFARQCCLKYTPTLPTLIHEMFN